MAADELTALRQQVSVLERLLQAKEKTLAVLMEAAERESGNQDSALTLLKQNAVLERVMADKTAQMDAQRDTLLLINEKLNRQAAERDRMELELRQAQKLESVGRLAAGVAHELNTPIQFVNDNVTFASDSMADFRTVLAAYRDLRVKVAQGCATPEDAQALELLEQDKDLAFVEENLPLALARSIEGLTRVASIVRSMKEFAHPAHKDMALADVNRGLLSTLDVARNEYKYVADVHTDLADIPQIMCFLGDLNQVFLNLVVNAAHAIGDVVKDSGARGIIHVETRCQGGQVTIRISDTGAGIPDDVKKHIFEPFFTTKAVGRGTGQGLAISRQVVVEKHGGTLTFESTSGRGTTFTIVIPARTAAGMTETGSTATLPSM